MKRVKMGSIDMGISHGAAIDTGTSLIAMPSKEAVRLNEMIGATRTPFGQYMLNCSSVPSLPSMTLTFGDYDFELKASGSSLD